jgi:hypothetical protein
MASRQSSRSLGKRCSDDTTPVLLPTGVSPDTVEDNDATVHTGHSGATAHQFYEQPFSFLGMAALLPSPACSAR